MDPCQSRAQTHARIRTRTRTCPHEKKSTVLQSASSGSHTALPLPLQYASMALTPEWFGWLAAELHEASIAPFVFNLEGIPAPACVGLLWCAVALHVELFVGCARRLTFMASHRPRRRLRSRPVLRSDNSNVGRAYPIYIRSDVSPKNETRCQRWLGETRQRHQDVQPPWRERDASTRKRCRGRAAVSGIARGSVGKVREDEEDEAQASAWIQKVVMECSAVLNPSPPLLPHIRTAQIDSTNY